jgi:hypothetical protein
MVDTGEGDWVSVWGYITIVEAYFNIFKLLN